MRKFHGGRFPLLKLWIREDLKLTNAKAIILADQESASAGIFGLTNCIAGGCYNP
jgi:hypothetical protein